MDKLKPRFLDISHNLNLVYFFPTSFLSTKTHYVLNNYLTSLIFLLNIFTKNRIQPDLSKQNLNYLFYFLNNICILNVSNSEFIERIVMRAPVSYLDLFVFLQETFFISLTELDFQKERIIAEYIAFKRFYSQLISEYGNTV